MFEGAHTAIVTPFKADGAVDYDRLRSLIEFQIEGGIDGIVPVGTTGESPTLTPEEHKKVIEVATEAVAGRVKVIAGAGSNATDEAIEFTQHAKAVGAPSNMGVMFYPYIAVKHHSHV